MVKKKEIKKHSRAKHLILTILIALVLVFFIAYAIQSIYPGPEYEDYCGERGNGIIYDDQTNCIDNGGQWSDYNTKPFPEPEPTGYCDMDFTCRQEYDSAREIYERNVFFANLLLGILAVIASLFLMVEAVSTGFMGGGSIMLVYGTIRYWGNLSDILRTFFLGIALFILIYLGYKKLK
ncbi:hypothetical protein HN604_03130 [archaeon]|jgi:hypothetical protein|nr:hypothetical protein [archaeon]MBT6183011.1 hypothetical protein [archaeon]MBT6606521.1 hypothetical protein [archaeon]MBT6955796.1 hypothetical protein [archaeon]MBT7251314.1 hypothetical protein [archaeon]